MCSSEVKMYRQKERKTLQSAYGQIWMLSDEWLSRYELLKKLEHKTLTQCDGDAND